MWPVSLIPLKTKDGLRSKQAAGLRLLTGSPLTTHAGISKAFCHSGDNFASILETISPTIKTHFTNGPSVLRPRFS